MNKESARKAVEFATVVRQNDNGTVVRVPGHGGRIYWVLVSEATGGYRVTCRRQGKVPCPSNGRTCYHALAAVETVAGSSVAWCENRVNAEHLANLGGSAIAVRSTQSSGIVWGVVKGDRPIPFDLRAWANELEANVSWWDASLACQVANAVEQGQWTPQVGDSLVQLIEKHPEVRELKEIQLEHDPKAALARGRVLLRGKKEERENEI